MKELQGDAQIKPSRLRIGIIITIWYFFSFITLFLNKYILSYEKGDPVLLGMSQMLCCSFFGYLHLHPCFSTPRRSSSDKKPPNFYFNVFLVGGLRFSTVLLGLVTLWHVTVSFAETVKSSAPVFTMVLSWLLLGERTSWLVLSSLLVVMSGLAICSASELSYNTTGFIAAMATNLSECLQNVYSKKLLSNDVYKYSPAELQCYTALASLWVQLPAAFLLVKREALALDWHMAGLLFLGGLSFHCQSFVEYVLLGYISPITHSVANTAKRALLIWASVHTFGNTMTWVNKMGTAIVLLGVLFYNKARQLMFLPPPLLPHETRSL